MTEEGMGMVRRVLLFGVVLGVMSVSIHGQVSVTVPLLGFRFAVMLAVVLDVGALLALNEVLTTRRVEVRRWGWTALLLAAGLSVGLNVWHAVASGTLPLVAAVAVGAIPVVLAGVLSHLLALSLSAEPEPVPARPVGTAVRPVSRPAPAGTASGTARSVADRSGPAGGSGSAPGLRRTGGTGTAVAAASVSRVGRTGDRVRAEVPVRSTPAADVEGLPAAARAVWERACELDARHRADTGRAAPYTLLRGELGIGQSTVVPLYRALAVAAESTDGTPALGTGSAGGAVPGSTGTEPDPSNTTAGTTHSHLVPADGTGSRLALVSTAGTEPALPGTGENDDQDSTDASAVTAGR